MSGGYVAYHLRHNKSVDREVFLEGIQKLSKLYDISNYTYIGFGGPMLEDFKHVHYKLLINKLISIENDKNVYPRQLFNKPFDCIDCTFMDSHEFIDNYHFTTSSILWLDYGGLKSINRELRSIEVLSRKVLPGDILKITIPLIPDSIFSRKKGLGIDEFSECFERNLENKIGKRFYSRKTDIKNSDYSDSAIIRYLSRIIIDSLKNAIELGLSGRLSRKKFIPLVVNSYNDGHHTMLTLFGIFEKSDVDTYRNLFYTSQLNNWEYISKHWHDIQNISIPSLTIKEKIEIDSKLPTTKNAKKILIDVPIPLEELTLYKKYYRLYPNFQRMYG